jgi:predicted MFS family arabinose efflux permease
MAITTTVMTSFWLAYPLFFGIMVLVSARMGPFQALLSEIVPDERRGSLMSLSIAVGQLAMGIGSMLAGFVYTNMGYTVSSILGAIGMLLMGVIVWLYIPETRTHSRQTGSKV